MFKINYDGFFDRKAVQDAVGRATARNLARAGALVRTIAKRSMRRRADPNNASAPGQPPHSHPKSGGWLRKFILFALDGKDNVVIGPARNANAKGDAPELMEHGGSSTFTPRRKNNWNLTRGGHGPIRGSGSSLEGFAKLHTPEQVARAKRIGTGFMKTQPGGIWSSTVIGDQPRTADYPKRPFMAPALEKARGMIGELWRDTVRG